MKEDLLWPNAPDKYEHSCFTLELAHHETYSSQMDYSLKRKGKRKDRQRARRGRKGEDKEKKRRKGSVGGREGGTERKGGRKGEERQGETRFFI